VTALHQACVITTLASQTGISAPGWTGGETFIHQETKDNGRALVASACSAIPYRQCLKIRTQTQWRTPLNLKPSPKSGARAALACSILTELGDAAD